MKYILLLSILLAGLALGQGNAVNGKGGGITDPDAFLTALAGGTSISAADLAKIAGGSSNFQTQIDGKAPIVTPTFIGTVIFRNGVGTTGLEWSPTAYGNSGLLTAPYIWTDQISTAAGDLTIAPTSNTIISSGNLTVDTSTLFVDAANNRVGIGTNAPDVTLDVRPIPFLANQSGGIKIADAGGNWPFGIFIRSDGFGSPRMSFDSAYAADAISIDGVGNVGIGTISPTSKLTVAGSISATTGDIIAGNGYGFFGDGGVAAYFPYGVDLAGAFNANGYSINGALTVQSGEGLFNSISNYDNNGPPDFPNGLTLGANLDTGIADIISGAGSLGGYIDVEDAQIGDLNGTSIDWNLRALIAQDGGTPSLTWADPTTLFSSNEYFVINPASGAPNASIGYSAGGTGFAGLWLAQDVPAFINYSLLSDGNHTYINAPNDIYFRSNNVTYATLNSTQFDLSSIPVTAGSITALGVVEIADQDPAEPTSAVNVGMGHILYANNPDVVLDGQQKLTDGVTNMFVGTVTGSGYTSQAAQYLAAGTGATTGSTAHMNASPSVSTIFSQHGVNGLGVPFDNKWVLTFRADINGATTNTDGYFVFGSAVGSTSTAQPSTKSCGFRFHDGAVYGFVHDGSSYTETASSLASITATNVTNKYAIHNDGTNLNFYFNGALVDSLTAPTGATGHTFQGVSFWANNETTTSDMLIRIHGGIKFTEIP